MSLPSQTIQVALPQRAYSIQIGPGSLADAGRFLHEVVAKLSHVVLITDTNVGPHYAAAVAEKFDAVGAGVDTISIEPGEQTKSAAMADSLWQRLLELSADRKTVVAAARVAE